MSSAALNEAVSLPMTERVDKWLWAVRLFKTRSLATEACRRENVEVNGEPVKPARDVRAGDKVIVRQGLITRTLQVVGIPPSRVGAKQVLTFCNDHTPPEEFEKARMARTQHFLARERGAGRPTKRERRELEDFWDKPADA